MTLKGVIVNVEEAMLRSNGRIAKSTIEAIQFVESKGVRIIFVSGRNVQFLKRLARHTKNDNYFVSHAGSCISNTSGQLLRNAHLSEEQTYEVVLFLEKLGCNIRIVHENFSIGNRNNLASNTIAKAVLGYNEPLFYPTQFTDDLSETIRISPVSAPKIEAHFTTEQDAKNGIRALRSQFAHLTIAAQNDRSLDITPPNCSVATAVDTILAQYDLRHEEMLYIAGALSDVEVYSKCALKVAMAQSDVSIRATADWLTRSADDDGVAYVLKEIFRKQFPLPFLKQIAGKEL
ncbi:MAG: HAD hydrolase family protein [Bacilli bacterium]